VNQEGILRQSATRLLGLIPTLLVLITIAFFLIRVAPGGPFDSEKVLPPEIRANLDAKYHLDEPLVQQYFRYLGQIITLDFGPSFQYKDWTVNELIARGFPVSMTVGGLAMLLAFFVGTFIGITAALRQNTAMDYSIMGVAMLGISIPNFVVAPLLILVLAVYQGWLPAGGWDWSIQRMVLPVITLATGQGFTGPSGDSQACAQTRTVTGDFFYGSGDSWPDNRFGRDRTHLQYSRPGELFCTGSVEPGLHAGDGCGRILWRDYHTAEFHRGSPVRVDEPENPLRRGPMNAAADPKSASSQVEDPFAAAMAENDVRGRSLWVDAWHRLLKNRAAVISGIIMFIMLLMVLVGPLLSPWEGDFTDWDHTASPPNFETGHWFGTDAVGRDILVRTLEGGRISLLVGLVATLVSLAIGVSYGAIAGYYGGFTDRIMMRMVDIIYALPFMFFVILLMVVFGRHIVLIFVAIGAVNWLDMARIVRGQTLGLKNTEFVEAARACGVDHKAIIRRHIIPNLLGVVMVYVTLTIPQVILVESFLSFLGLGVQEPMSSWGALVNDGAQDMESAPWTLVFPAAFLTVTLYCFNYIGDGMRDALDPKDRA
jgi:oligopeptide transport system permease protein